MIWKILNMSSARILWMYYRLEDVRKMNSHSFHDNFMCWMIRLCHRSKIFLLLWTFPSSACVLTVVFRAPRILLKYLEAVREGLHDSPLSSPLPLDLVTIVISTGWDIWKTKTDTHCGVVKQDMAPFIFYAEERDEDDHQQESDHTENNYQTTVSHQEREQWKLG